MTEKKPTEEELSSLLWASTGLTEEEILALSAYTSPHQLANILSGFSR